MAWILVNVSQCHCLFTHVGGVTSVSYFHNVKLENLAFGLFRNSGKSDLMSNIRKISNSFFLELKDRYLIDNKM